LDASFTESPDPISPARRRWLGLKDDVGGFARELLDHVGPARELVFGRPMIRELKQGTLPVAVLRTWAAQEFDYISSVQAWHGLLLRRIDRIPLRNALVAHMSDELRTDDRSLWLRFAKGWGLSEADVLATELLPEMQALNDYLWRLCLDADLVEPVAALNVALKGITEELIGEVWPPLLRHYHGRDGVSLDEFATAWFAVHVPANLEHRRNALILLNEYAQTPQARARAKFAARRALEYLALGFDGCYRHGRHLAGNAGS
jgi:pyrroloquinoline quinone (PQQ) biosynthesis protein C